MTVVLCERSANGASTGGFNFTNTGNVRPTGVIGGAQIGANYEFAPWVVGVEASWTDSAITGSTLIGCTGPCVNPPGSKPPAGTLIASDRFTSEPHWFAALTGRVGYAANDWLFYAKGGGALMHVTYTEDLLTVGGGATALTQIFSDNRTGFTVGVGLGENRI